ncbi:MAG: hypothetical protein ACE366_02055 [Bradymonadia bacterium]
MRHTLFQPLVLLAIATLTFGCEGDDDEGGGAGGNAEAAGGSGGSDSEGLARLFGQDEDQAAETPRNSGADPSGEGGGEPARQPGDLEDPAETPASAECLSVCADLVSCLNDLCAANLGANECDTLCIGVDDAELAEVPTCDDLRMVDAGDLCDELFGEPSTPERTPEPVESPRPDPEPEPTDPEPTDPEPTDPEPPIEDPVEVPQEVTDTCCAFYDCASDCFGDGVCVLENCDPLCGAIPGTEGLDCESACASLIPEAACY